jgi:oxygen-independent coproporphyrinogen-3 oxidase
MSDNQSNEFALYIHIPYCSKKCPYCDFNAYAVKNIPEEAYVAALIKEIGFYAKNAEWTGRKLRSIYFGGGTPSILKSTNICRILDAAKNSFDLESNLEITLEANPGDLNYDALALIFGAGINRLSLGVQSLNAKHLKTIGRWHDPETAIEIVKSAQLVGFKNISLDLMFALPEQTLTELEQDLKLYLDLNPQHISAYELSIEKGTNFFQRYNKIDFLHSEDDRYLAFDLIRQALRNAGFNWYEISNYSRPGFESKHNQSYWEGLDYLGIGAGAHSFYSIKTAVMNSDRAGLRFAKIAKPEEYLKMIAQEKMPVAWEETLNAQQVLHEYIFSGLRTSKGLELIKIERLLELGNISKIIFEEALNKLADNQLINRTTELLIASDKGRLLCEDLANKICESLDS